MPLLVASQPDEEVIVFYTQKSPHMNYENVRLLKETDKEAKFIKCFEGSNALDFQLVTQLGYLLCENQENSYVIISNDTGFDAAVRYWKQRNMPVQRLSGKELNRRLQQKAKANGEKEIVFEPEKKADGNVAGILADEAETLAAKLNETTKQNETGELDVDLELNGFEELTQASKQDETGELDAGFKLKETGELAEVSEPDEIGNRIEVQKLDEAEESDESPEQTETVKRKETAQMEKTAGAEEQSESGEIQMEIPDEIMRPDETVDAEQELPFTDLHREKNEKTQISETQDEVIRSLLTCISKDRLADFHNALVLFFGEETGKELYQEAKNSSAYAICRVNQTAISEEEKFDVYCQTVFAYSDPKLDCPEDFSSFLYKANAKRKNLNSLRAALQGHYGKDKGMKYYSLFKSHIKIMNRM